MSISIILIAVFFGLIYAVGYLGMPWLQVNAILDSWIAPVIASAIVMGAVIGVYVVFNFWQNRRTQIGRDATGSDLKR
ncbi:uncharacterized membrane protein (DUF485 family) [Variovorax boronicumulans]|uniref:Uncharacterized membrane protein (DUF485 family) n=1 Tax=Variovorax boronicumulans TaxID=436515 RepID=A0AAW8D7P5_9BURK|nr:hypothetical protein [Variovorax boronicumulans]MDP9897381.1 uncharacterized membrane protein (DUF485 family) [Variovorax boronicumulans]MDQ0057385.1 uncharacterized membrane protein (DUF485 family) [Variovorax boronicumulans]